MDPDLIARVYPILHADDSALNAIETSSRYVPPRIQVHKQSFHRHRRGLTEPPDDHEHSDFDYLPCVELRFSNIPRSKHGLVFGCDPKSDVVLPSFKGISYHHFTLTFDAVRRLIVRDWGSVCGTEVTYDKLGRGKRRDFRWIVGSDQALESKKILVHVTPTIQFQIVSAHHDISSQTYINKVDRFCRGAATAEDLFNDLNFPPRPDTELPTGEHTPATGPIYLRKELGKGAFGVVTRLWDVSNGEQVALKEPAGRYDDQAWRKEARIMGQISHDNIVKLVAASFRPHPRLYLEFAPMGSLEDQNDISSGERISILRQCLSALNYLHHEKRPPIAHRDIKTANILVQHRFSGSIHVKLSDFGLSRDSNYYESFCGTPLYIAPEIYELHPHPSSNITITDSDYTVAVDIWSLGVVIYELLCELPRYLESYRWAGRVWGHKIIQCFETDRRRNRGDNLRNFLLDTMVVMDSGARWSARECLDRASKLFPPERSESRGQNARGNQAEQATIRYLDNTNRQNTAVWNPQSSTTDGSAPAGGRRYEKSGAPPPDSPPSASQPSRKRRWMFSSSSAKRRGQEPITDAGSEESDRSGQSAPHSRSGRGAERPYENKASDMETYDAALLLVQMGQGRGNQGHANPIPPPQAGAKFSTNAPKVSQPSTRDVFTDRPGFMYMVIRRMPVSMRTSDFHLNASEILDAGGVYDKRRAWYQKALEKHCRLEKDANSRKTQAWVPFRHGVFLCQETGLEDELRPLLSRSPFPLPRREDNYLLPPGKSRGDAHPGQGGSYVVHQPHGRTTAAGSAVPGSHSHRDAERVAPRGNHGVSRGAANSPSPSAVPRSFNRPSNYTEPDYRNGSYLAPAARSHLELAGTARQGPVSHMSRGVYGADAGWGSDHGEWGEYFHGR